MSEGDATKEMRHFVALCPEFDHKMMIESDATKEIFVAKLSKSDYKMICERDTIKK